MTNPVQPVSTRVTTDRRSFLCGRGDCGSGIAWRTPCNPWDMRFPLCVGRMCDCRTVYYRRRDRVSQRDHWVFGHRKRATQ